MDEFEYNLWDIHATRRSFERLSTAGALDMARFDMALYGPALTMGLRGLRVDEQAAAAVLDKTWAEVTKLRREADRIHKFTWSRSTIKPSPHELKQALYDELRAPVQTNRDGGRTTDMDALEAIVEASRASEAAVRLAELALALARFEEDRKVLVKPRGRDGRMHTGFGVASTVTSRWSSRRDAFNEGANLHALSRRVRRIFTADPGFVLVNRDLSQAESLGVAFLSSCEAYKAAHYAGNVHHYVGSKLWPHLRLTKEQAKATPVPFNPDMMYYDLFKRIQHASNYGQSAVGFARISHIPIAEARRAQAAYFGLFPEIRTWHAEVRHQLRTFHRLTTPMGRVRQFLGRTWDESTAKEAIAHVPQSLISDINKVILFRLWRDLDPALYQCLLEIHDSNLGQVREADLAEFAERSEALALVPISIGGDTMRIGSELEAGYNWGKGSLENPGGLVPWKKRLPHG